MNIWKINKLRIQKFKYTYILNASIQILQTEKIWDFENLIAKYSTI